MPTLEPPDDAVRHAFDELSSRNFDPAASPAEGDRLLDLATATDAHGELPPRRTELFVRFAGAGVSNSRMPVAEASGLLELLQAVVTNIGSANLRGRKPPKGIRRATKLFMTPDVRPGSLVFRLEAEDQESPGGGALDEADRVDSVVDDAVAALMRLMSSAETSAEIDADALARQMRPYGSRATSNLNKLAIGAQRASVDVDLGLWSRSGKRQHALLGARGVLALRSAAERNKKRTDDPAPFEGILHTVSDGKDDWRLELDSGDNLKLKTDPSSMVGSAGSLLSKRVRVIIEVRTIWSLAKGTETKEYRMLSAEEILPADADESDRPA